jgi:cytochrome c-type biogenesis protein CcmH/NrfG
MLMAVLVKTASYDRARLMKRASGALGKRKRKKAIALYRKVLATNPDDTEAHRKLAPLLAQNGEVTEALKSYRKVMDAMLQQGFDDRAIGLLRAAAGSLPREFELWKTLAALQVKRGKKPDAVEALLEGRSHFRRRQDRGIAIVLLMQARKLEPGSFRVSYDLACQLGREGRVAEALGLLEQLVRRPRPPHLRRVRARQLLLAPSPAALWRLLRACLLGR